MACIQFYLDEMPRRGGRVLLQRRTEVGGSEIETLQTYTLSRRSPHVTRHGEPSAIMTWRTQCMTCAKSFLFTTGLNTRALIRRCPRCRRGAARPTEGWPTGPRNRHIYEPPVIGATEPAIDRDHETPYFEDDDVDAKLPIGSPEEGYKREKGIDMRDPSVRRLMDEARNAQAEINARQAEWARKQKAKEDDIDPDSLF